MVQLPIEFKERRCTEEVACEEAYDGDIVNVHGHGSFKITMYD
jgi:peptide subunit release factor RF-3